MVVVGAGIVGLCVAEAAAARGARVLCLDPAGPGRGQSIGPSRILRHAHADDALVALARRSCGAWASLAARLGEPALLQPCGVLVRDDDSALRALGQTFDRGGVRYRRVTGAAPLPGTSAALLDEDGGVIDAERAVAALARGVTLVRDEALAVSAAGEVLVADGRIRAGAVVVAAGLGTPSLVGSLGIKVPLAAPVHVRVTFRLRAAGPTSCVLDRSGAAGERAYGVPVGTDRYAVGVHAEGAPFDEQQERTCRYVAAALPALHPEPVAVTVCQSVRPVDDPDGVVLTRAGRVVVLTGGNLFKFAPTLGEDAAALALDGAP